MHSFVLQDWIKLSASATGAVISQPENAWLDLEHYQDVVFYLQVTDQSGSPTISFQTSPTADDSLFTAMGSAITMAVSSTPVVVQFLMLSAAVPLARYVRWQLSGSNFGATFRVMVSANAPGM